jgi:hypothetical protein
MPMLGYTARSLSTKLKLEIGPLAHNHKHNVHLHKKVLSGLECQLDGRINFFGWKAEL